MKLPHIGLERQLYFLGFLRPILATYFFFGQDLFHREVYHELDHDISSAVTIILGLSIVIDIGFMYLQRLIIRERNYKKFRMFWLADGSLFVLAHGLHIIIFSKNFDKPLPHISIDLVCQIHFWVFVLQGLASFQFLEVLKREQGCPQTWKMLGIGIRKLLYFQMILQWINFASWLNFHLSKSNDAASISFFNPVDPFYVYYWMYLPSSFAMGLLSIPLYIGIKKNRISFIKGCFLGNMVLSIIMSFDMVYNERSLLMNNLTVTALSIRIGRSWRLILVIFKLCALSYFMQLLRDEINPIFSIGGDCSQNWKICEIKRAIRNVKISNWRIQFDTTMPLEKLAEGKFGSVHKGKLRESFWGLGTIPVAVKVLKYDENEGGCLDSLVSEMKSLLLTQSHPNLVKVYGIAWRTIDKGIVMEYCSLGSLKTYLLSLRNAPGFPGNISEEHLQELLNWAIQIASAMEFIGRQQIVHGDLAIRNILLDSHKVAKITDFGMSIRLYNYQIYAKSDSPVLPWRWMAPESLTDLKFSSKSDVWSYGITLWEMYTFGGTPWVGLNWSSAFVERLKAGVRLPKPSLVPDYLYDFIMKRCWHLNEDMRIAFEEILGVFHNHQSMDSPPVSVPLKFVESI